MQNIGLYTAPVIYFYLGTWLISKYIDNILTTDGAIDKRTRRLRCGRLSGIVGMDMDYMATGEEQQRLINC